MAADGAALGSAAPAIDWAALRAWLDGASYDAARRGIAPPAAEFADRHEVFAIVRAMSPALGEAPGTVAALFALLRFLRAGAERPNHPLARALAPLVAHHERMARDFVEGGLAALASGAFALLPPAEGPVYVRGCLWDMLSHTATQLAQNGFFDTAPGGRKSVIVVNGRYRTGSTLVLNAANEILKAKGQGTRVRGANYDGVDHMIQCFGAGAWRGHWLLVKSHNWLPREAQDGVFVFYTMRNLADVAGSMVRRRLRLAQPIDERAIVAELRFQKLLNEYASADRPMLRIDYDTWCHDKRRLVAHLARAMNMTLSEAELGTVAAAVDTSRVKAMTDAMTAEHDEETQLRRYHISETLGTRHVGLDVLPPRIRDVLAELGEWPGAREG